MLTASVLTLISTFSAQKFSVTLAYTHTHPHPTVVRSLFVKVNLSFIGSIACRLTDDLKDVMSFQNITIKRLFIFVRTVDQENCFHCTSLIFKLNFTWNMNMSSHTRPAYTHIVHYYSVAHFVATHEERATIKLNKWEYIYILLIHTL